jgi:hypothetical protein
MLTSPASDGIGQDSLVFYRHVLETLRASGLPFLVGGSYAFNCYTGIGRNTKDLDIFIRRRDYERISEALLAAGYVTDLVYPHWLAKIHSDNDLVDLIFSSGNGTAPVDDAWFDHASRAEVLGIEAGVVPLEEMIWSKAFVMERERYDGADIAHLLLARGGQLDWRRLLHRFAPYWRVLLSHLILFGFVYPAHRDLVPAWVMEELLKRLRRELRTPPPEDNVCSGTLLSREQYLPDIEEWGYRDARLPPAGTMSAEDVVKWTGAIQDRPKPP